MPGADPGSGNSGQCAASGAPIPAGFVEIRKELFRRNRIPGKMKEQQVLKVDPYPGGQAAGIRAPGTGLSAQIVQKRKNRHHPGLQLLGQNYDRIQRRPVPLQDKIEAPVGRIPFITESPGGSIRPIFALHNLFPVKFKRLGDRILNCPPVSIDPARKQSKRRLPFGGNLFLSF